jgi:hypothetical protein
LSDDPDILQRLKALELARIQREIMQVKEESQDATSFERFLTTHWLLLDALHERGAISDSVHDFLRTACPWCGSERAEAIVHVESVVKNGSPEELFRCRTCGHEVRL